MSVIEKKFYNLFWNDPACQAVFSTHSAQLLENEVELIVTREKFLSQRIVLTNSLKRKSGDQLSKRAENDNIEIIHNLKGAVSKYFDETRIEQFISRKFGQTITKVEKDLKKSGGWYKLIFKLIGSLDSEEDLFKLLSDYNLISSEIKNVEQFMRYVEKEIIVNLKSFVKKENLFELAISIDLVSTYYNIKLKNNLVNSIKHYTDILFDEDNFNDRLALFDTLFEMSVIKGGKLKSYYECVNCPPNTYNGILTLDVKPTKLKMKCPNCKHELFYVVPYELDKTIYNHIVHKDGLLFFAIKYLLHNYDYTFSHNVVCPPNVEFDFCLMNESGKYNEIIEVKMFKKDRPVDTQVGNLKDAVSQVKKAVDKMCVLDSNYKLIPKSIVTNLSDENAFSIIETDFAFDLKEYNIQLYSIKGFYQKIKR